MKKINAITTRNITPGILLPRILVHAKNSSVTPATVSTNRIMEFLSVWGVCRLMCTTMLTMNTTTKRGIAIMPAKKAGSNPSEGSAISFRMGNDATRKANARPMRYIMRAFLSRGDVSMFSTFEIVSDLRLIIFRNVMLEAVSAVTTQQQQQEQQGPHVGVATLILIFSLSNCDTSRSMVISYLIIF